MGLVCGCTDKSSIKKDAYAKEGGAMSDREDSMMENHYKKRQMLALKDMNLKNKEFRR
jgi:hypothetical protein